MKRNAALKIWIVNHFAYGPDQGAGTRHYSLAQELQERGHDPLIIASSFYHKGRKEARLNLGEKYRRQSLEGVPFQWIRTPPYLRSPLKRLWNMWIFGWRVHRGVWRNGSEQPDVILGSSPSPLAALAAYRLSRKLGTRFVLEIRDLWPDALCDIGGLSKRNPVFHFFKWIERFLYRNADLIVTVLPGSYEHIIANGGDQSRIVWIPNGVKLEERPPLAEFQHDGPFTVTYFGAHGPYSGLEQLVDAAGILKDEGWTEQDIRFVLIGESPKSELISRAEAVGVRSMVDFRDAVAKGELWKAIEGTDAFLMIARPIEAHKKGISPNKVWEYFAAARPVLFSIYCGDEMADDSGAGISVTPGDPGALAGGIQRLYSLPPKTREEMGKSGLQYVKKTAEVSVLGARLEEVLYRVITIGAAGGTGPSGDK